MASKKAVRKAARTVVRTANRYQTPKEGVGVVQRAARKGELKPWVVKNYRQQVRRELGADAARKAVRSVKTIDAAPKKARVAKKAAKRTATRLTAKKR